MTLLTMVMLFVLSKVPGEAQRPFQWKRLLTTMQGTLFNISSDGVGRLNALEIGSEQAANPSLCLVSHMGGNIEMFEGN